MTNMRYVTPISAEAASATKTTITEHSLQQERWQLPLQCHAPVWQNVNRTGRTMVTIATFGVTKTQVEWRLGTRRRHSASRREGILLLPPPQQSKHISLERITKGGWSISGWEAQTKRKRANGSGQMEVPGTSQIGTKINRPVIKYHQTMIAFNTITLLSIGATDLVLMKETLSAASWCV